MPSSCATPVRFVDRAHILISDGWVVRATSHPAWLRALKETDPPVPRAASVTTAWTTPPRASYEKRREAASSCNSNQKLGTRRGKQRWSALVSAPTSRLAKAMRTRLGDAHWLAFVLCVPREQALQGGVCQHVQEARAALRRPARRRTAARARTASRW